MPSLIHSVPKYRLHRASGQAIVTLGGRDYYLGPHGTAASKPEYDRLIGEYLANGRAVPEQHETDAGITVVEVLSKYWLHCQSYYRKNGEPTSEVDAMKIIIRDIKSRYCESAVNEFGPLALKSVRQIWIDRGLTRQGINKNQRRLLRIFRWAVAEELISANVIQGLSTVPGLKKGRCDSPESPPVQSVNEAVILATIKHAPQIIADMIRLQLLTASRPGEICAIKPESVDCSKEVWEYCVLDHKAEHHGRTRTIYFGPQAQAILSPYMNREPSQYCFSPLETVEAQLREREANRKTPPGYGNRRGTNRVRKPRRSPGERYTSRSYARAVARACQKAYPAPAEVTDTERKAWMKRHNWSPNQLRHTAAGTIRKLFGLEAVQTTLGHASADTSQIYAERDKELAVRVAKSIG